MEMELFNPTSQPIQLNRVIITNIVKKDFI